MRLVPRDELEVSFKRVVSYLTSAMDDGSKVARMPDGSLSLVTDPYAFLKPLQQTGSIDAVIRSIIIKACERAEGIAPGSTRHLLRCLDLEQGTLKELLRSLPTLSRPASMVTLRQVLSALVPDVTELLMETLELAGSECKIFVEPSQTGVTVVEKVLGYSFTGMPDANIYKSGKWTATGAKCLIIDGIVEKVSEIDSLLRRCSETKGPMVIFARGFSGDVLTTLRVNHARKTLNVMPVLVEFDIDSVNVLLDIAAVVGCDIVSSLKGELISMVKYDDIPVIKSITCVNRNITIINDSTSDRVRVQLQNLIQKRAAETLPGVRQILDKRIRSLSSSSVVIRVTDSGSTGSRIMSEIDVGLKAVRAALSHGVLMPVGALQGIISHPCPTLAFATGAHQAISLKESLSSVGVAVIDPTS